MLSRKSNQMMHNVIKEIKPSKAQCYQGNQTKRCYQEHHAKQYMLSYKPNQTMHIVIRGNQTKQCIMLSGKSFQTVHNNIIRKIKPNKTIKEIKPDNA